MRFELYDWLGLAGRRRMPSFMRGLERPSYVVEEEGLEQQIYGSGQESDRLAGFDAYVFYYSEACRCSLGYVKHRLGQLQDPLGRS